MTSETLLCQRCKHPVRVVRLGASTLALGHIQNPKNERHMVQLSRSAADRDTSRSVPGVTRASGDRQPQIEGLSSAPASSSLPASEAGPDTAPPQRGGNRTRPPVAARQVQPRASARTRTVVAR